MEHDSNMLALLRELREPWAFSGIVDEKISVLERMVIEKESVISEQGKVIEAQMGRIVELESMVKSTCSK